MTLPPTDALCIHCDAVLTPRDLSDGWCDSCGKRLPGGARRASPVSTAAPPAPTRGARKWALVVGALAFVALGAAAAIAAAG